MKAVVALFAIILLLTSCQSNPTQYYRGTIGNLGQNGKTEKVKIVLGQRTQQTMADGTKSVAFELGTNSIWFVLFHPPIKPDHPFKAKTDSQSVSAWLVRTQHFSFVQLYSMRIPESQSDSQFERLRGTVDISSVTWRHYDNLDINVDLIGDRDSTSLKGKFRCGSKTSLTITPLWLGAHFLLFGWDAAKGTDVKAWDGPPGTNSNGVNAKTK